MKELLAQPAFIIGIVFLLIVFTALTIVIARIIKKNDKAMKLLEEQNKEPLWMR